MEYDVVFNAVESYQQLSKTLKVLALISLVPTILTVFQLWKKATPHATLYEDEKDWVTTSQNKIMAVSITGLYVLIFTLLFGYANSAIQTSKQRLEAKNFLIIEGNVVELSVKVEGRGRAFTVNDTKFEYFPHGNVNPGQFDNDCKKSNCVLNHMDKVKIYYYSTSYGSNKILKVMKSNQGGL